MVWRQADHFPSRLAEIAITPQGYLVRGYFKADEPSVAVSPFVDLLDPATGKSRWGRPIKDLDRASAMMLRGDTVWLASPKRLMSVALPTGQIREHAKFDFKGDELPNTIEDFRDLNGAFVLLAGHNLIGVAPSGEVRFQRYFSAPGRSFWSKALEVGLYAAAAAVTVPTTGYYVVPAPSTNRPVANPWGREALLQRQFAYMLTGSEDSTGTHGFSVVKVDKVTGREVGRAWVDDRSPDYWISPKDGILFLLRDKLVLEAIRF
jgi:hypothetical protein